MGRRLKRGAKINDRIYPIITIIVLAVLTVGFVWAQTNLLLVKEITYSSINIPRQYSGYKIAHISNIDNERQHLASKLKNKDVDIIIVSGGLVDSKGKYDKTIKELDELNKVADTFFVAQEQDIQYIDDIASETDAVYLVGKNVILPEIKITADEYIKLHCDDGITKQIEEGTDEAKKYVEYIAQELEKSKDERLQLVGVNGHNENIYDTKDELYALSDYSSSYRLLAFGNYKDADELTDTGVNIVMTGGTYGVIDELPIKDGSVTAGDYQLFVSPGVCKSIPKNVGEKRFMNFTEIQIINLHDGMIYKRNPLERFIDLFMNDTGTIFDNDGGYSTYTYRYDEFEELRDENYYKEKLHE